MICGSYNRRRPMSNSLRLLVVLLAVSLPLACAAAGPYDTPAIDFANRIHAASGAGPITLTYVNHAGLEGERLKVLERAIETQLRASGVKIAPGSPEVRITFSRNDRGWLWIAETPQGSDHKTVFLAVPEVSASAPRSSFILRRQLLLASEIPILDVLKIANPSAPVLLALTPEGLLVYQQNGGVWTQQQEVRIQRDQPMPRDPRGLLVPAADHLFDIYLPGMVCTSGATLPVALTCRAGDDLWPLGEQNAFFNASRNYFTGLLRPGFSKPVAPFYSAAAIALAGKTTWIFTGIDGKALYSEGNGEQPLGGTNDWGSDIAALHGCSQLAQVLAAGRGDDPEEDSLRAYEVLNRQASPSSPPMLLNGAVTALWTHNDPAAVVVIRVAQRERYEAYSVDLSCN